jgi:CRISPR-associated protein Csx10
MKIKLTTLSQVLCASGESTANIDSDLKYDKYGFPYIQGRTFKGLLRESAEEVCEILGDNKEKVNSLFGTAGNKSGSSIKFNDLRIENYAAIEKEIISKGNALKSSFIQQYYTTTRQQTRIEKGDTKDKALQKGTAKDKSLRRYRLLKEGVIFETEIENVHPEDEAFLEKALTNLRYIGTRRNRGFGKVKIEVNKNAQKAQSNNIYDTENIIIDNSSNSNLKSLKFNIKTLDNIVVGKVIGEQNTVSTEKYIPAQNIRGLIAGLIIKNEKLNSAAHENDVFKEIILSGNVCFNNAFKRNTLPIPLCYGYDKTNDKINDKIDTKSPAEIVFGADKPLKTMRGFATVNETKIESYEIETEFSFHNSRFKDRLAGRSTKKDGAIFYYEAIAKNQEFTAEIFGKEKHLNYIQKLLEQNNGIHRVGKSKTAQYSKVKFKNFDISDIINTKQKEHILFTSPVITYNENGIAIPDKDALEKELKTYNDSIEIKEIAASHNYIENFMSVWSAKTPAEKSFVIGTTLKISSTGVLDCKQIEINGLGERKSEGYGRLKFVSVPDKLERIKTNSPPTVSKMKSISYKNELLKKLKEEQEKEEKYNKIKITAVKNAIKHKGKLPNSLISRLYDELTKAADFGNWNNFISNIKGKKAEKTLEQARLFDSISKLKVDNINDFDIKKQYYLTFFKSMRQKNKALKKDSNE